MDSQGDNCYGIINKELIANTRESTVKEVGQSIQFFKNIKIIYKMEHPSFFFVSLAVDHVLAFRL
jgi:hypothetical protein